MGMDVYGKNGNYFRNNVWWWRPLAHYCQNVAPEITSACAAWHSNDGDGLDAHAAVALAIALQTEIDSGKTAEYAAQYEQELAALPNVTCELCEGTGIRRPIPERGAGDVATGIKCNACDGSGKTEPWEKHYPFSVENVQEFVDFLKESGGFEIC